ncbi:hypothetical protein EQV97_22915 [Pseudomonas sp. TMW22090]|uniref:hypothetical protein n=1 Tax=Pseudomonas sp. TMW22090 TaxID=2506434 RepID=UPI001F10B610|nr:hypothetical protein [Pseudomonas sp. TMW22090]MCH4880212.1 hypothetical protein [Pseudomonas sp. TMW22090]
MKLNRLAKDEVEYLRDCQAKAMVDCVVVERDWPEYHLVWAMLEHRMAGKPVPDFNAWRRADELQQRLNAADQRIDELATSEAAAREELDTMTAGAKALRDEWRADQARLKTAEQRNTVLVRSIESINASASTAHVSQSLWKLKTVMATIARITNDALKTTEPGASHEQ